MWVRATRGCDVRWIAAVKVLAFAIIHHLAIWVTLGASHEEFDSSWYAPRGAADEARIRVVCAADDYAWHCPNERFVVLSDPNRTVVFGV
jgi:hypothetical protein